MDEGSVKLDGSSISALVGGETITVDKVEINDVPDVIDTKVGDRPVFEVSVGDIHDFGDGRLTISLAYALSVGESADNLQVWHFNDDGSYTIEQCQYDGSKVTFSTGRLSYFSIMHVEPPADDPDDGDDGGSNMMIFVGVGAGALVIVGIAVFFLLRRKA